MPSVDFRCRASRPLNWAGLIVVGHNSSLPRAGPPASVSISASGPGPSNLNLKPPGPTNPLRLRLGGSLAGSSLSLEPNRPGSSSSALRLRATNHWHPSQAAASHGLRPGSEDGFKLGAGPPRDLL
eukprot:1646705-Rhodomonas_salina.3